MNLLPLLIIAASFLAAGLLCLGGSIVSAAALRAGTSRYATALLGATLCAVSLCWPSHVLQVMESSAGPKAFLAALALVWLAVTFRRAWTYDRGRRTLLYGAALPLVTCVYAVFAFPGLFGADPGTAWLGAAMLSLVLPTVLVLLQVDRSTQRFSTVTRLLAAVMAACVVGTCAVSSLPSGSVLVPLPINDWLEMIAVAAAGALLLESLGDAAAGVRAQRPIERRSAFDNLTGLPTRRYFEHMLSAETRQCDDTNTQLAVMFIDLDGFKSINDSLGHSVGDRVLEQVGLRLNALARTAGAAARVGSDEFLLLARGAGAQDKVVVARLADHVIEALGQPYLVDEHEVTITCSIGIAIYPDKFELSKLIACADAAMYVAKRAGGARHCLYAPEMDNAARHSFDLLRDLRQALTRGEFQLVFQPKIDASSGKVTGVEALLRWHHPTRGLVMPGEFIPMAERSGLIGPLGNWVIESACKQARAWRDKGLRMRVAINLSAYQMRQDDIADRIADALTRHRIHPSLLTCEITESAAMQDTAATQETFRRLGELGTHLSIDDFGTGYSSLSYLRRLPATELKIDASFVRDLDDSADARAVIDAVIKLAHALGLKVVAEGVETTRQHKLLVELRCDELQGYLFAKPMSAGALLEWAIDDRSASSAFRDSLFGETRQTTRQLATATGAVAAIGRRRTSGSQGLSAEYDDASSSRFIE